MKEKKRSSREEKDEEARAIREIYFPFAASLFNEILSMTFSSVNLSKSSPPILVTSDVYFVSSSQSSLSKKKNVRNNKYKRFSDKNVNHSVFSVCRMFRGIKMFFQLLNWRGFSAKSERKTRIWLIPKQIC